jgi:hypothetical protein
MPSVVLPPKEVTSSNSIQGDFYRTLLYFSYFDIKAILCQARIVLIIRIEGLKCFSFTILSLQNCTRSFILSSLSNDWSLMLDISRWVLLSARLENRAFKTRN